MTRRDPTSSAGCVMWPEDDPAWKDSGEGGMWAAALILAEPDEPWNVCISPTSTIALPLPDVVVHDPGDVYSEGLSEWTQLMNQPRTERREREIDRATAYCGRPVLACVLLGASGGSWVGGTADDYFEVTPDVLDLRGRALIAALTSAYQRDPVIVTYLDT